MKRRILAAALTVFMLLTLLPTTVFAEDPNTVTSPQDNGSAVSTEESGNVDVPEWDPSSTHYTSEHDEKVAWEEADQLPSTPGNYYLTTNVTLSATWSISESIHLDLNGYSVILQNEEGGSVINISSGTLTLCDSVGTGVITGGNAANAEDGKNSFSASQQQTLDEQYRALSKEQKRFYDKISAYAASKEGSKCNKNQRYQEYKIGAKRIVRLRIKRGILHCEFLMINRDLRNHFSESKIPVKETATVIKVQNTETVQMVFSSIDLAVQLIEEERAYKKQLAKERRRQTKQQAQNNP